MSDHFKLSEYLIDNRDEFAPSAGMSIDPTSAMIHGTVNVSALAETFLEWQAEQDADRGALHAEGVALFRAYYAATYDEECVLGWDDFDADQKNLARELATVARELHPESNR